MSVTIRKPKDNRFIKAVIFAPAGAGKTVWMGTAQLDPRTAPMLILDFEGGTESLSGLDVDVAPITSWEDYNEVYENIANGETVDGVDYSQYKSLGIDSISETHKFALLDIIRKEGPSRREPDALQQQDYGKATIQMRRLLREFRDLPLHVFFTAHAKEVEIPREGRVRVPDLAGQMAEEVSGLVSVQGYLAQFEEEGEMHRTLLLHSFPKFRIKARTPWGVVAPEEIVDPTVTDVLDALGYGDTQNLEELKERGSSRGKQIADEVPDDEDPERLPGDDGKPPAKTGDEGDVPVPPEEEQVKAREDLSALSLKDLRAYAEENNIELNGARNRTQALAAIEAGAPTEGSAAWHAQQAAAMTAAYNEEE